MLQNNLVDIEKKQAFPLWKTSLWKIPSRAREESKIRKYIKNVFLHEDDVQRFFFVCVHHTFVSRGCYASKISLYDFNLHWNNIEVHPSENLGNHKIVEISNSIYSVGSKLKTQLAFVLNRLVLEHLTFSEPMKQDLICLMSSSTLHVRNCPFDVSCGPNDDIYCHCRV